MQMRVWKLQQLEIGLQSDVKTGFAPDLLDGVARASVPTVAAMTMFVRRVKYMPALWRGMAQQQYSLTTRMGGGGRVGGRAEQSLDEEAVCCHP